MGKKSIILLLSVLISVSSVLSETFALSSSTYTVSTSGIIKKIGEFVYSTDFENVTKVNATHSSMTLHHNFNFEGSEGASFWIEGVDRVNGPTPHSGNHCIGMELTDITKARRNEFNIANIRSLAGDDIHVSVWLYLPNDWGLHAPDIDWNWYSIGVILGQQASDYKPYVAIHIGERGEGGGSGIFDINLNRRFASGSAGIESLGEVENFSLPRGRWFNLKYEFHRRDVDSSIKLWIDNQLLFDVSGFESPLITGEYKITVAKIYHDTRDTTPHYLWVDDLEIYRIED